MKTAKDISAVSAEDYMEIVENMLDEIDGSVEDTRIYLAKYKSDSRRFAPQIGNVEYGLKQVRDKAARAQRMFEKAVKMNSNKSAGIAQEMTKLAREITTDFETD